MIRTAVSFEIVRGILEMCGQIFSQNNYIEILERKKERDMQKESEMILLSSVFGLK